MPAKKTTRKTTSKAQKARTGGKKAAAPRKNTARKGASKAAAGGGGGRPNPTRSRVRANRTLGISPKQDAFLEAIRQCPIIKTAAKVAGIHHGTHYDWLENDPAYPEKFKAAFLEGRDLVLQTMWKLGVEGVSVPKLLGEGVIWLKEWDSKVTLALAKGWMPEVFSDSKEIKISGGVDVTVQEQNARMNKALMSDPKLMRAARAVTKKLFELTEGDEEIEDAEVVG